MDWKNKNERCSRGDLYFGVKNKVNKMIIIYIRKQIVQEDLQYYCF